MTEDESFNDVDISDIIENSERFGDNGLHNTKNAVDSENISSVPNSDFQFSVEPVLRDKAVTNPTKAPVFRPTRLPTGRVKNIMKMDPDVNVISSDAVFLVAKATEMFLETIAKETYSYTNSNKRKTISKKDLELIINKVDCLCFLEGAMDF